MTSEELKKINAALISEFDPRFRKAISGTVGVLKHYQEVGHSGMSGISTNKAFGLENFPAFGLSLMDFLKLPAGLWLVLFASSAITLKESGVDVDALGSRIIETVTAIQKSCQAEIDKASK